MRDQMVMHLLPAVRHRLRADTLCGHIVELKEGDWGISKRLGGECKEQDKMFHGWLCLLSHPQDEIDQLLALKE